MAKSSTVRIALVGVGRIADLHAGAYARDDRAVLAAVCDADEGTARQRAGEWSVDRVYTDYARLLADPDIDAVEILTPSRLHAEMTLQAAAAGKHVSVQKPMALTVPDALEMVRACEAAGVVLKVCENYVFYPPLVRARELIDAGAIGTPLNIGMRMIGAAQGGWPIAPEAWQWRLEEAQIAGGPQTFDHGHHMYSSGWYLLGRIDKIHAWINHLDAVIDSPATLHWNHVGGLAQGSVQFVMSPQMTIPNPYYSNDEWFEIVGTSGIIWVNQCTASLRSDQPPVVLYSDGEFTPLDDMEADWAAGFDGALRNFVDAVAGDAAPLLSGEEGVEILAYDLAGQRSHQLERPVYVEEMYSNRPNAVYTRRRRQDVKAKQSPRQPWWSKLFGSDDRHAPRCRELTRQLIERFDGEAVADWTAVLCVDATGEGGGQWTFRFDAGTLEIVDGLDPAAELTVALPAGTWAAILLGRRKVETAFLQGKLKIDGQPEAALPLRKAFGL